MGCRTTNRGHCAANSRSSTLHTGVRSGRYWRWCPGRVASRLWDGINVLAYVGACVFSIKLLDRVTSVSFSRPRPRVGVSRRRDIERGCASIDLSRPAHGSCHSSVSSERSGRGITEDGWLIVFGISRLLNHSSITPLLYIFLHGGHKG